MDNQTIKYSTKKVSKVLLEEIISALKKARPFGSIEIFVQGDIVTQITTRNIKKTKDVDNK